MHFSSSKKSSIICNLKKIALKLHFFFRKRWPWVTFSLLNSLKLRGWEFQRKLCILLPKFEKRKFSWSRKTLKSVLRGAIKQKRCINFLDSSRKVKILFLYQPLIRIILMYCLMYANVSLRYAYCSHPASQDYSKVIYPKYSKYWP